MNLNERAHVNNKVDVFDELEVPEAFSDESSETDSQRAASGVDIVDSINRAAFKRRADFNRSGFRSPSKIAGSHH